MNGLGSKMPALFTRISTLREGGGKFVAAGGGGDVGIDARDFGLGMGSADVGDGLFDPAGGCGR